MLSVIQIVTNNTPELLSCMEDSLSIYDQALYYQRQEYFRGRNNNEKYKVYSFKDLWDLVKLTPAYKDSKLDIGPKTYAIRQVSQNWRDYMKALKSYHKNPSNFKGKPGIPNYLHKRKKYNIVQVDSSRFRTKWCKENEIRLPNIQYKLQIPLHIKMDSVHMVSFSKFYDKIKFNIVYEDLKYIDNEIDKGSAIGIDIGLNNLCAITANDKSISYVVKGGPLKSINQYYNKRKSELVSELNKCNGEKRKNSKKLTLLSKKRNLRIEHYMHTVANSIIKLCLENKIENICIGHNNNWKQDISLGKRNNQNFVSIPFNRLINIYLLEVYIHLKNSRRENFYFVVYKDGTYTQTTVDNTGFDWRTEFK